LLDPDGALAQRTARAGDALLFVADDGVRGPEVWRSDGSEAGTALLRDLDPRDRALLDDFALPLVPVGDRVVFAPRDADVGVEPWISDGTDAGTRRLADIGPGTLSGLRQGATFAVTGTHVFMEADDGVHGRELWAIRRAALDGGPVCAGDCNGDTRVGIEELVRGVGIALGSTAVDVCPAFDRDGDAVVSIAELIAAVGAALNGCPSA
jgi:ELWxxDGT repeat protein